MPDAPDDDRLPTEAVDLLPGADEEERRRFLAEQFEDRPLGPEPGPYPYVVTRHFPGVYSACHVVWRPPAGPRHVVVTCPDPYDGSGALRPAARSLVVAAAAERAAATGFRHCAVFAEGDAVYVDPDGTTKGSTSPPRWGRRVTWRMGTAS